MKLKALQLGILLLILMAAVAGGLVLGNHYMDKRDERREAKNTPATTGG